MKRIRVKSDFAHTIAQAGLTLTDFAAAARVNRSTLHALINPAQHPDRRGGMLRTTAWKLAQAYAKITGLSDQQAFERLLVEEEDEQVAV